MTNEQIIEKAYDTAVASGWDGQLKHLGPHGINELLVSPYNFIFDHNFAKAFWKRDVPNWRTHLQRMVLADDPVAYLEDYL